MGEITRTELILALVGAEKPRLAGVDLSKLALNRLDLENANLRGATLQATNLQEAILRSANMTGVNMTGTQAPYADFNAANLTAANLTLANLTGARLTNVSLTNANLNGANLTNANLRGARVEGVRFDNAAPPDMAVAVDPQDLAELLGNLIENAARHAGSLVRVTARRERGRDLLAVEDDGPGLADPDRARAVLRGVRLDVAGAGAGLGLAIVRDIADAYGGELRLERSSLGGLSAEVELPAAAGG